MMKRNTQILESEAEVVLMKSEAGNSDCAEIKKTTTAVVAATEKQSAQTRDFSSIFARLKKSARKKSVSIL